MGLAALGQDLWAGKPAAIVGATLGAIGTAVAQSHLRGVLTHLGMNVLNAPEIYLQHREGLYTAEGEIADESFKKLMLGWVAAFGEWVERLGK